MTPADSHPARWRMLALLSAAELLGMSLWFTGSAAGPELTQRWHLSGSEVGGLTTLVQFGFVAGTALSALLNLADIVPARVLFGASAVFGALSNLALLMVPGYAFALVTRFFTGFFLAGVYPPAMKMAATWFQARRGLAVGTVVGALTIGKAGPYLVHAVPGITLTAIVLATTGSALAAAVTVLVGYHDGPYQFPSRRFSWSLVGDVFRERRWRLALGGYLGHMAELYSYWTWIPVFVAASIATSNGLPAGAPPSPMASVIGFGVIAIGGLGCVWGGLVADRIGRERLVIIAMALSGTCALLVGLTFGRSLWLLAPVALVWGFFVIADSAQFSVLAAESVPAHTVGTALTLQVCLGFLLTTLTIQLVPPIVDRLGWAWAFPVLAVGPALGIGAIKRLKA